MTDKRHCRHFLFGHSLRLYFYGIEAFGKHFFVLLHPLLKLLKSWIQLLRQGHIAVWVSTLVKLEHISKFYCTGESKSPVLIQSDLRIL